MILVPLNSSRSAASNYEALVASVPANSLDVAPRLRICKPIRTCTLYSPASNYVQCVDTYTGTLAAATCSFTAVIPSSDRGLGVAIVVGPSATPAGDTPLHIYIHVHVYMYMYMYICLHACTCIICREDSQTWYTGVGMTSYHCHLRWLCRE